MSRFLCFIFGHEDRLTGLRTSHLFQVVCHRCKGLAVGSDDNFRGYLPWDAHWENYFNQENAKQEGK